MDLNLGNTVWLWDWMGSCQIRSDQITAHTTNTLYEGWGAPAFVAL